MTSARSFGNYPLAGAIADLIDNSIKADASHVNITALFNHGSPQIHISDNGDGMSESELILAMRPASTNPDEERSPDDLGRFGWGMKSASFSQCRKLTVVSLKAGVLSGACWDLDDIDSWKMAVLGEEAASHLVSGSFAKKSGTEVIWKNCDRLSEDGSINQDDFNHLISESTDELALIFHRFLSGEVAGRSKLRLSLNGSEVKAFDPFLKTHAATQVLEEEPLTIEGNIVRVRPYVLPHFSKLLTDQVDNLGGRDGYIRNQGFYVYRSGRLILHGTWFGLAKFGELSQLVRISVDIPNSMDHIWKITVDKADAQLPTVLKNRLKQIIDGIRKKSVRVYQSKGGLTSEGNVSPVWNRYVRNNELSFTINREHPTIKLLFDDANDRSLVTTALSLIEKGLPITNLTQAANNPDQSIKSAFMSPEDIIAQLEVVAPRALLENDDDFAALAEKLRLMEPFSKHWNIVNDWLEKRGWITRN